MIPTLITLIIGAIGLAAWVLLDDPPPRPLDLPNKPFPDNWRELLQKRWPLYNALPEVLQHQLEQLTLVFLDRIEFQGVDLEITDEMRVLTAAQACLLLLNQDTFYSPQLRSVVIHPRAYTATSYDEAGGEAMEKQIAVQGQSWGSGSVVLSWDNTRTGAANAKDGRNLALHEFAHQLDQADGKADGAPALGSREQYQRWQKICSRVFADLRDKVERGNKTVIDDYGATNPAEFFAVATETFFEKPHQLNKRRPELYALLSEYYRVNPLSWP
jgi:Mlc titration factor MtfA (ptsG expression regulator)